MKVMELRYCCNEYPNPSKSPSSLSSPPQACPQLNRIILSSTQSKVYIILYQANNTGEGWHQIFNRVLRVQAPPPPVKTYPHTGWSPLLLPPLEGEAVHVLGVLRVSH